MIIDFHTHIFPDDVCEGREKFFSDDNFRILYESEKSRLIGYSALLEYMDKNCIDYSAAMSFPWEDMETGRLHNDYMAMSARSSSGRIISFGIPHPDSDIEKSVVDMKENGIFGVGEIAFYGEGLTEKNYRYLDSVLGACELHSMPVCIHVNEPVGHKYAGKYEPSLGSIYSLIEKHPEAKILLSHWGGGMFVYELMPEVRKVLGNVFYDTAASPYLYDSGIYRTAAEIAGKKILFGSDYPLLGLKRYEPVIRKELSHAEDIERIMGKNSEKFLKLSGHAIK